jgi:hypothetical protein
MIDINALSILNPLLDRVDGFRTLYVHDHGLAGKGLDKDLHVVDIVIIIDDDVNQIVFSLGEKRLSILCG